MAKAVLRVHVILREHSEQEIRAMLLECNMHQNFAINRLLSQQGFFLFLIKMLRFIPIFRVFDRNYTDISSREIKLNNMERKE